MPPIDTSAWAQIVQAARHSSSSYTNRAVALAKVEGAAAAAAQLQFIGFRRRQQRGWGAGERGGGFIEGKWSCRLLPLRQVGWLRGEGRARTGTPFPPELFRTGEERRRRGHVNGFHSSRPRPPRWTLSAFPHPPLMLLAFPLPVLPFSCKCGMWRSSLSPSGDGMSAVFAVV